jgi:hypothetical protein
MDNIVIERIGDEELNRLLKASDYMHSGWKLALRELKDRREAEAREVETNMAWKEINRESEK